MSDGLSWLATKTREVKSEKECLKSSIAYTRERIANLKRLIKSNIKFMAKQRKILAKLNKRKK